MEFGIRKASLEGDPAAVVVKDATTATFLADVIEPSRDVPVVVDFWAPWCGPCKQLTPIIEKVVRAQGGKIRLVKINVDENQAVAAQLRVQSLPTVYAFRDGQPIDGFVGAQTESVVKTFIERLVNAETQSDVASVLQTGSELLESGDLQGAAEIFAAVLHEDRENADALAGLAQCYLKSGDIERARQTLQLVAPDKRGSASVQSAEAAITLAEKGASTGDVSTLIQRIESNPKDHEARLNLALALASRGQKNEALEHLLELVRLDRKWNEEAARKQLVQFFDAWGAKDPLVAEGRRRLSSILFS